MGPDLAALPVAPTPGAAADPAPLIPVILCGGAGSRLWPVSRELHPKPFIRLADGRSLLQKAFLRAVAQPGVAEVLTVTNRELVFKTADDYREVDTRGTPTKHILEPFGRNTAPAIAAAALQIAASHGEHALMLVLPADHLIADLDAFAVAVAQARALAADGRLVTFGIRPTSPETGYGYLEADGHRVRRFVEKPSADVARGYVASGRFLWNAGMFCFAAGALLREMAEHCPAILEATRASLEGARRASGAGFEQIELDAALFAQVPEDSIDYALMERSARVAVVPCDIGWSDIGSWSALGDIDPPDAAGNRTRGEVLMRDARDCTIHADDRLVAAVGIDNLMVIDTPDALLVAHRDRAQDVRHLYAELKSRDHPAHRLHRTVHRPWGTYTVLEEGPGFKIKRIVVTPGRSLSLQMHYHRSEHWVVVSGIARVVNGERELFVRTNESTYIAAGIRHRLENPGRLPLVMIEVQSGGYLEEDDIVRFDDTYGRAAS
jgi:mannose-1-phosphate guanylyltransferase